LHVVVVATPLSTPAGRGEVNSICNPSCIPRQPAPEGRHNLCRGREAPGSKERNSLLSQPVAAANGISISARRA